MIDVTPAAKQQMDSYFTENEVAPIRIFMASGCGGSRLALALDEPGESDQVVEVQGYTFVMDKELYEKAQPLTVDMSAYGFDVKTAMEMPSAGGGCSGCTSCG